MYRLFQNRALDTCRKPRYTVAATFENQDFYDSTLKMSIRITSSVEMVKKYHEMIFIILPIF